MEVGLGILPVDNVTGVRLSGLGLEHDEGTFIIGDGEDGIAAVAHELRGVVDGILRGQCWHHILRLGTPTGPSSQDNPLTIFQKDLATKTKTLYT